MNGSFKRVTVRSQEGAGQMCYSHTGSRDARIQAGVSKVNKIQGRQPFIFSVFSPVRHSTGASLTRIHAMHPSYQLFYPFPRRGCS